jgi:hypothetical protein
MFEPNAGATGSALTGANGNASFICTSVPTDGSDFIRT